MKVPHQRHASGLHLIFVERGRRDPRAGLNTEPETIADAFGVTVMEVFTG